MKRILGLLGMTIMLQTAEAKAQGILGGIGSNWNTKTKSTVIGGALGAGAGAILSKDNKLKGAAIGGLLGAGAGYLYGRHKEKKAASQQNYIYYAPPKKTIK
ncbi:MAG: glycine zipper 2TM domain-containing protein [Chitinophagaceae bacterium]|nr:MAG: glycine zipper 2TM domain-containing protein [Chitinophagaceae bacterium]